MSSKKADGKQLNFVSLLDTVADKVKDTFKTKPKNQNAVAKNEDTESLNILVGEESPQPAPVKKETVNIDFLRSQNDRLKKMQQ